MNAFVTAGLALGLAAFGCRLTAVADDGLDGLRRATGCDAWRRVALIRTSGTHFGDGLDGRYDEVDDVRDGRFVERENDAAFRSGVGFDGQLSWTQDFGRGSHVLNAPSVRAIARSRAWLRDRGWCLASTSRGSYSVEPLPAASRASTEVLRVVPRGAAPIVLTIDRTTHLLQQTMLQLDENRELAYYDDWRLVDDVPIAFTQRVVDPEDDSTTTFHAGRVALVSEPARNPSIFARPAAPRDVSLPAQRDAVSVPYVLEGDKPMVDVRINGKGPFPFVLDSGGHFILSEQTARRLSLSGSGAASSVNEKRVAKVGFTHVRRLEIGAAVVSDQVAEISPESFSKVERGPRPPKAGWLGLQLFERFAITFDGERHRLILRPLSRSRPRPKGQELPLVFAEDAPLVACSVRAMRGLCMLDTGNAGPTIAMRAWAAHHRLAAGFARGVRVGGRVFSRTSIALGNDVRFRDLLEYPTDAADDDEPSTTMAAILSEHFIDGFVTTFDYGRGSVYLQPSTGYRPQRFSRTGVFAAKQIDGTFIVRNVLPQARMRFGSIRQGDVILSVDGIASHRLSGADFVQLNATPIKRFHRYRIRRGGEKTTIEVETQTLLSD